ncbi:hypothetical protein THAOC_13259, partial [Thalassiosira oceanica]
WGTATASSASTSARPGRACRSSSVPPRRPRASRRARRGLRRVAKVGRSVAPSRRPGPLEEGRRRVTRTVPGADPGEGTVGVRLGDVGVVRPRGPGRVGGDAAREDVQLRHHQVGRRRRGRRCRRPGGEADGPARPAEPHGEGGDVVALEAPALERGEVGPRRGRQREGGPLPPVRLRVHVPDERGTRSGEEDAGGDDERLAQLPQARVRREGTPVSRLDVRAARSGRRRLAGRPDVRPPRPGRVARRAVRRPVERRRDAARYVARVRHGRDEPGLDARRQDAKQDVRGGRVEGGVQPPLPAVRGSRGGDGVEEEAWLIGGASNVGCAVLRQEDFSDDELASLSAGIDPDVPSPLSYYPLPGVGERFPVADSAREPVLEPRPGSRGEYLHGILQGISDVERDGYRALGDLGSDPARPAVVLSCGGGARNDMWLRMRGEEDGRAVRRRRPRGRGQAGRQHGGFVRSGSPSRGVVRVNAMGTAIIILINFVYPQLKRSSNTPLHNKSSCHRHKKIRSQAKACKYTK